jgi:hypothetical protein
MTMNMRWFALGAAAIALGACSDTTTSPLPRGIAAGSGPSLSATLNGNSFTILSDASSQYCASAQVNGNIASFPSSFASVAGCGAARDLQADGSLTAYNPGWANPTGLTTTTAHWIGFDAKSGPSSDYRANVGEYVYQQTFTLPANVTAPTLSLDVMADNVVAVYLNGNLLGSQAMVDCNTNPNTLPCHWTVAGALHVTAPAADFHAAGLPDTLTFLVVDLATGFPSTVAGVGGTAPQWACGTRPFQANGTVGFTATLVPTSPAHVIAGGGAGTLMTNIGAANQAGCENPTGVVFAGTVSWTPPSSTIWCSPGFWKNQGIDLWTQYQGLKYNAQGPYAHDPQSFLITAPKKGGLTDPTLLQVISNPSQYGGEATNNVASFISNKLFGTPRTVETENCPDVLPLP